MISFTLFLSIAFIPNAALIKHAVTNPDIQVETDAIYPVNAKAEKLSKTNDKSPEILYYG